MLKFSLKNKEIEDEPDRAFELRKNVIKCMQPWV